MKVKLKKEYIISEVKKNFKTAINSGKISICTSDELEPKYFPKVVLDYIKNNLKHRIISFDEAYDKDEVFTLELFRNHFRYPELHGERLFNKIFEYNKVKLEGEVSANFLAEYDNSSTSDSDNETDEICSYEITDYYIYIDIHDTSSGGTSEYIFEVDENDELILPEINDVELEIEDDLIKDHAELRRLFLKNL